MKRTVVIFLAGILPAFLPACKKSGNGSENPPTVDDVVLTTKLINTPVAPQSPGNTALWFVLKGHHIFYGNASNTAKPQFFNRYTLTGNSFSSRGTSTELCSCGYTSKLIANDQHLYYIANEAMRFTPGSITSQDKWTQLAYPTAAKDNNGEAGIAIMNERIYFVGGRTASKKFKYYNINTNTWINGPDYIQSTSTCNVVAFNNKLYVIGGNENSTKNQFSIYDEATNTWEAKPALPFEIFAPTRRHIAAVLDNKYIAILMTDNKVVLYDIAADKWAATPILLTVTGAELNLFAYNDKLLLVGLSNSYDFALHELTVSYK